MSVEASVRKETTPRTMTFRGREALNWAARPGRSFGTCSEDGVLIISLRDYRLFGS
jgi:hypothetical protein